MNSILRKFGVYAFQQSLIYCPALLKPVGRDLWLMSVIRRYNCLNTNACLRKGNDAIYVIQNPLKGQLKFYIHTLYYAHNDHQGQQNVFGRHDCVRLKGKK